MVLGETFFLPEGASIRESAIEGRTADPPHRTPRPATKVTAYTTFVGQGGPRFWLSVVPEQPAPNYAQILVHTKDAHRTAALAKPSQAGAAAPRYWSTNRRGAGERAARRRAGADPRLWGGHCPAATDWRAGERRDAVNPRDGQHPRRLGSGRAPVRPSRSRPDRAAVCGVTNEDVASVTQAGLSGTATTYLRRARTGSSRSLFGSVPTSARGPKTSRT